MFSRRYRFDANVTVRSGKKTVSASLSDDTSPLASVVKVIGTFLLWRHPLFLLLHRETHIGEIFGV